jgi:hypothetical protein
MKEALDTLANSMQGKAYWFGSFRPRRGLIPHRPQESKDARKKR